MVSTQDLAKVTKFCSTVSRSAPSPPLRRGDVYCLSSFTGRAAQWYKEEIGRQSTLRCRGASPVGTRRQPSRTAKDKFRTYDYVLPGFEVDAVFHTQGDVERGGGTGTSESTLLTPPGDETQVAGQDSDPEASFELFRTRLSRTIQTKALELKGMYDAEGIKHLCTVVDTDWDCVDEEYCGHGLVDKCLKWVPKRVEYLRSRMKADMETFFSATTANNHPERLRELKKNRCSLLKKATLEKLAMLEVVGESHPEAIMEAEMLESPTLGRWPGTPGFLKEDIKTQTTGLAGLTFAVDVCLGEPRILML